MAEESDPEKYAPPDRRAPKKQNDVERIAFPRQQRSQATANGPVEELNAVIRRVGGPAMQQIDQIIRELESVRDMMRKEGERVSREVAGYASLGHEGVTAMQVLADSIKEWRDGPDKSDSPSVCQHYRQQPLAHVQPAITARPDPVVTLPYKQQIDTIRQRPWIHYRCTWFYSALASASHWITGERTAAVLYRSTSLAIAQWRKYFHSIRAPLSVWISASGRNDAGQSTRKTLGNKHGLLVD
jgi:hypothetical protein